MIQGERRIVLMLERMQQERLSITRMGYLSIVIRVKENCGHRCRWECVWMSFLDHFCHSDEWQTVVVH